MTTLPELFADLEDEYGDLRRLVEPLSADAADWDRATPAVGWAVRDQISHLAFFDGSALMAMVEPERFSEAAERAMASEGDPMAEHLARGRSMDGDELLSWWGEAHTGMAERAHGRRSQRSSPVVRPADGVDVIRFGPADGDLGAWPGCRRCSGQES